MLIQVYELNLAFGPLRTFGQQMTAGDYHWTVDDLLTLV